MFELPERYKVDVKIPMKDFVPRGIKPEWKKKIRDAMKEVELLYQIAGEEIPSVINEEYRCEIIQVYDICLKNIKDAPFLASTYQGIIKSFCIIRFHDSVKEQFSFALKRLSQTEENQIVVTDSNMTEHFLIGLPDRNKRKFQELLSYQQIRNKTNKVNFYMELYTKQYMFQHKKAYAQIDVMINKPIWYDEKKVRNLYAMIRQVVQKKELVTACNSNSEKVAVNQEIKELLGKLEEL